MCVLRLFFVPEQTWFCSVVLWIYSKILDNKVLLLFEQDAALLEEWRVLATVAEREAFVGALKSGVSGGANWLTLLDKLGLTVLIEEINLLDIQSKAKFLNDFAKASDDALRAMNNEISLFHYWKANGKIIKFRVYPNSGNKPWIETKNTIIANAVPDEVKILEAIENQSNIQPLSNNKPVMAGAYCNELGGEVSVKYNLSPIEKAAFDYNSLDPIFKEHIDFLNFIRRDALKGSKLFENLYTGVSYDKLIAAGDAASHAEILAVDEIVKSMRAKGLFNNRADLSKIKILVKGKNEWGNMCRCPHCFQLSNGVKTIINK